MPTGVKVSEETKRQVVALALGKPPVSVPGLAERYGISRKSIYRWLDEYKKNKEDAMAEAKQPEQQPNLEQAPAEAPVEAAPETPQEPEQVQADVDAPAEPEQPVEPEQTPEVAEPVQPEQPVRAKVEDTKICINPSCGKTYAGTKCGNCGYDETLAVH